MAILGGLLGAIGELTRSSYELPRSGRYHGQLQRSATQAVQALTNKMLGKLAQPLFHTDIRAYIVVKDRRHVTERVNGLLGSLAPFSDPGYQALVTKRQFLLSRIGKRQQYRLSSCVSLAVDAANECLRVVRGGGGERVSLPVWRHLETDMRTVPALGGNPTDPTGFRRFCPAVAIAGKRDRLPRPRCRLHTGSALSPLPGRVRGSPCYIWDSICSACGAR